MSHFSIYAMKKYGATTEQQKKWRNMGEKEDEIRKAFKYVEDVCEELENDKCYHFLTFNDEEYILYGDLDGYDHDFDEFEETFIKFMKDGYGIKLKVDDIKYTHNEGFEKDGNSFHFSIPKYYATGIKIKEIMMNYVKYVGLNKRKNNKGRDIKEIDEGIYKSTAWFRCPNQTKGIGQDGKQGKGIHKIMRGEMCDFVIDYIPKYSINIDDYEYLKEEEKPEKKTKKETAERIQKADEPIKKPIKKIDVEEVKLDMIKKLVDILDSDYYNDYNEWYKIGMILKREGTLMGRDLFDIFDEFSKKSTAYKYDDVLTYWKGFKADRITITLGSLNEYAKKSDMTEYKKIMREYHDKNKIEITEKFIADTLHERGGSYFYYKWIKDAKQPILYSFNTTTKLWYKENECVMKKYIATELYDYLFNLLNDSITDASYLKQEVNKLKAKCGTNKGQDEITKAYKTHYSMSNNNNIEFDTKYYLLGFLNGVYDLKTNIFRDYEYSDYMTTNTGYNYVKSTKEDRKVITELIEKIETNEEKRFLLYQILATGAIGQSYHVFVMMNGAGGNGKSVLNNFMRTALGHYAIDLDMSVLCSKKKEGADPALALLNNARYAIASEPNKDQKIKNGNMKIITGGKKIVARNLFSNDTDTNLMNTLVIECNKKIVLEADADNAEKRRIIDFLFESKFTTKNDEVDEENRVFKADKHVSTDEFLNKYKCAFIDIIISKANAFLNEQKTEFIIPKCVEDQTEKYIDSSYIYMEFLNNLCERTDDKEDFISMQYLYEKIKESDLYYNSSKEDRRKITKKALIEFFENNDTTKKLYCGEKKVYINNARTTRRNILCNYKFIENDDN
jgi:phage/plasmid-associated DNA primase